MLRLSDFDYPLPPELIAQHPLKARDACRLMVVDRARSIVSHRKFSDIGDYLRAEDLLVLNDTKVLPCRLFARRSTGGRLEVLLLRRLKGYTFQAYVRPQRVKVGERIQFNSGKLSGVLSAKDQVRFSVASLQSIYRHGVMPLPPYIKRRPIAQDRHDYQTVYARAEGAVAAPTAGLHFTQRLLRKIEARGVRTAMITLHVGPGTFKPVRHEDILAHKMDEERFRVSSRARTLIDAARPRGGRIFCVGTTVCRALETYAGGKTRGETGIFIYPGYRFRMTDCLLTNFHLPRTTLYMLVCAFAGTGLMKRAYQEAIQKKYRFYSYGDAMLIL
ncbi:MAG: tRNA preQ1(34) S-adenosylmethionine ribosyltransferase-isomerase QueA [Candidatus Omnitrophica bacterium]|nr:tRNA preQ1(34) S-adenosylmethionine ribosyltransferase-isomerase QueA [Candidatus Omnitrophota bacterium]